MHSAHATQYTVFRRFWVFWQCLESIQLIIDGYSYVTRLGRVFSIISTQRASMLVQVASGYATAALNSDVYFYLFGGFLYTTSEESRLFLILFTDEQGCCCIDAPG